MSGDPDIIEQWHERLVAEDTLAQFHPDARVAIERYIDESASDDLLPAILRYGRALDIEIRAREEWENLGQPVMLTFSNGMTGAHPLIRIMQASAKLAADMHKAAGLGINAAAYRRPQGRPVGAVSAPDRRNSPPRNKPVNRDSLGPLLQVVTYPDGAA